MDSGQHQQLMNLFLEPFVERVMSESVTADDHSSANLMAMPGAARSRGFRVEHYVRPPVTLALDLCVAVTVSCVLLCPDLPTQAELRLELSGSNDRGTDQFRLCHGEVARGGDGEVVMLLKNPMSWKRSSDMTPLTVSSSESVCRSYAGPMLARAHLQEYWLRANPVLSCCRHLKVRISRWTGTKPVTLKWMELWGSLSPNCSLEEAKLFQIKWNASAAGSAIAAPSLSKTTVIPIPHYFHCPDDLHLNSAQHCQPNPLSNLNKTKKSSSSLCSRPECSCSLKGAGWSMKRSKCICSEGMQCGCASGSIPAQLLDEITFEVMALPMLLPSGHSVDQSTLEKLARADSACGRPPTDPFTGLPFTEQCKPTFCVELKTLLDGYLSTQDSSDRAGVANGKTVGSSKDILRHLYLSGSSSSSNNCSSRQMRSYELTQGNDSLSAPKRVKLNVIPSPSIVPPVTHSSTPHTLHHPSPITNYSSPHLSTMTHSNDSECAFDCEVAESLDLALDQLFNGNSTATNL